MKQPLFYLLFFFINSLTPLLAENQCQAFLTTLYLRKREILLNPANTENINFQTKNPNDQILYFVGTRDSKGFILATTTEFTSIWAREHTSEGDYNHVFAYNSGSNYLLVCGGLDNTFGVFSKLDESGNKIFSKFIVSAYITRILYRNTGTITLFYGESKDYSSAINAADFNEATGALNFMKNHFLNENIQVKDAIETSAISQFLVVGYAKVTGYYKKPLIMLLDTNLDILSAFVINLNLNYVPEMSAIQTAANNFYVVGTYSVAHSSIRYIVVIKLDSSLNLLWVRIIGGISDYSYGLGLFQCPTNDDEVIFIGKVLSGVVLKMAFGKLYANGSFAFMKIYNESTTSSYGQGFIKIGANGPYIIAGISNNDLIVMFTDKYLYGPIVESVIPPNITVFDHTQITSIIGSITTTSPGLTMFPDTVTYTNVTSSYTTHETVYINNIPTDITMIYEDNSINDNPGRLVATFTTTDVDTENHVYSLSPCYGFGGDDWDKFDFIGNNLKTKAGVDYTTKTTYNITVKSSDPALAYFEKNFTICGQSYYKNGATCSPCSLSCGSCTGPSAGECTILINITVTAQLIASTNNPLIYFGVLPEGWDNVLTYSIVATYLTKTTLTFGSISAYTYQVTALNTTTIQIEIFLENPGSINADQNVVFTFENSLTLDSLTLTSNSISIKPNCIPLSFEFFENPMIIHINTFPVYVSQLSTFLSSNPSKVQVLIPSINSSNFSYITYQNPKNHSIVVIEINYIVETTLTLGSPISGSVDLTSDPFFSAYNISLTPIFNYTLIRYIACAPNFYYNVATDSCMEKILIRSILQLNNNPGLLDIYFEGEASDMYNNIQFHTNVLSIESLTYKDFDYTIAKPELKKIQISFKFKKSVTGNPLAKIEFNYTKTEKSMLSANMEKDIVSINLFDYYELPKEEKELIETTKSIQVNTRTQATISNYASNVVQGGSTSSSVSELMLEMIDILKYIEINYPANVRAMFSEEIDVPSFLIKKKLETNIKEYEKIPPKFRYYKIDPYFFNNYGECTLRLFLLIIVGAFFSLVCIVFQNFGKKLAKKVVFVKIYQKLLANFTWNLFILTFSNFYLFGWVTIFIELVYHPIETKTGLVNLFLAIVVAIVYLFVIKVFLKASKEILKIKLKQKEIEENEENEKNLKNEENTIFTAKDKPKKSFLEKFEGKKEKEDQIDNPLDKHNYLIKYKSLFQSYKMDHKMHAYAFVSELVRYLLMAFIIICFQQIPLFQCVILFIICSVHLIVWLRYFPFEEKTEAFFYYMRELCLVIVLFCLASLAYYDRKKDFANIQSRMKVGWVLYYNCIGISSLCALQNYVEQILLGIKVFLIIRAKIKDKLSRKKGENENENDKEEKEDLDKKKDEKVFVVVQVEDNLNNLEIIENKSDQNNEISEESEESEEEDEKKNEGNSNNLNEENKNMKPNKGHESLHNIKQLMREYIKQKKSSKYLNIQIFKESMIEKETPTKKNLPKKKKSLKLKKDDEKKDDSFFSKMKEFINNLKN